MSAEQSKGEQAVEIFNLVIHNKALPAKLEKLVPLSFIGQAAVNFYRSKIKLLDNLDISEEQRKATLRDGQDAGEMLLDIEARIGELLPSPTNAIEGKGHSRGKNGGSGKTKVLPNGINSNRALSARAIARNPHIVEEIKRQARENEDIPTKTAVLNKISYEKEKAESGNKKHFIQNLGINRAEEAQYINALERVLTILPTKPPSDWTEGALKIAKSYAQIILKRLEVFRDGATKSIKD